MRIGATGHGRLSLSSGSLFGWKFSEEGLRWTEYYRSTHVFMALSQLVLLSLASFFSKRWVKLSAVAFAWSVVLPLTVLMISSLWKGRYFYSSAAGYRGQPMDSGLVLIVCLFANVYLVLYARKLLKQAPRRRRH